VSRARITSFESHDDRVTRFENLPSSSSQVRPLHGRRKDNGHAVSRVECIFALFCYWYTCLTSHPCPTTVRSALNHESLNTTHSPAPIRVVVEQPASAINATNIMVFILVPSPCSFRLGFKDAPASVDIAVSRSKGSAKSNMVTGRRISRIASTIQGSAMTHLRYRVGEEELTSGVQGFHRTKNVIRKYRVLTVL